MTPDDTARRLAEIRRDLDNGRSVADHDGEWLLDLVAERDARITMLEAALREISVCDFYHEETKIQELVEEALKAMTPAQHYVNANACKEHESPQREARFCVDCKDARITMLEAALREIVTFDHPCDLRDEWWYPMQCIAAEALKP